MDEEDLQPKIDGGQLILVPKSHGKSAVWNRFSIIVTVEEKKEVGFVQCSDSKMFIRYKSGKNGTSTLARYNCTGTASRSTTVNITEI